MGKGAIDGRLRGALLATASLAYALTASQVVMAQTTPAPQAADESNVTLEEIVVTAQRRDEKSHKVPISINAFSNQDLSRLSIVEPRNLQFSTPGLTFPEDNGTVNPYIRGRGTNFAGFGLEGSVAVYIDDVYLQTQYAAGGLFDVAQVQVLKGPQGTLYGRNATGGAVVIRTNDPKHEFGGYVQAGYGNLNWWRGEAVVNLPVTETLAVRLAGSIDDRDGHLRNVVDGKKQGGGQRYVLRGKALWEPTSEFSALLKVDYTKSHYGYQRRQIVDGTGTPTGLGFYETRQSPQVPKNQGGEQRSQVWNTTLTLKYQTDRFAVINTTAYRSVRTTFCSDNDNVYARLLESCVQNPNHILAANISDNIDGAYDHTFTSETRFISSFDGPLNITAGAAYQHTKARFPAIAFGSILGPLRPLFDNTSGLNSYAVYAEANYNVTSRLKLTAGGRYSKDSKSLSVTNNADVFAFGAPPSLSPGSFKQKASFNNFTPRVVLSYQVDEANIYASYSKGFKSGGFANPSLVPQVPLRPETIEGFEGGVKLKLLDDRLRLDMAVFHTKSSNVQVASIDTASNVVIQQNAAGAKADGAEANLQIAASRRLTLQIGAAYLHSRFTSFPSAAVYAINPATGLLAPSFENLKGFPTTNSPRFTANGNATYTIPLPNDWSTSITISGRYSTSYDFQAGAGGPLRLDRQKDFGILDVTGRIMSPNERITLSWYVNNLFQTHYYDQIQTGSAIATVGGGTYSVIGLPRTYGAALKYSF